MDPLTAFSVAGTVIQFVDYGTKLLLGAHDLYKSTSGALTANQELELVTADLRGVIRKLGLLTNDSGTTKDAAEKELQETFLKIRDEATRLATELMTKLERLKIKEDLRGHQRAWASLFKAVESAWSKDELHEMRLKLKELKEAMETRLLFSLREKFDFLAFKMCERFDALDRQTQCIISALVENRRISAERFSYDALEQTATLSQLLSRIELQNLQEHRKTRAMIAGSGGREIFPSTETLEVSRDEEIEVRKLVGNKLLESLRYMTMSQRFDEVSEAYQRTFNWIFDKTTVQQVPWSNLADWLQHGEGLYWLKGKAGSGKSTLMKYVFEDPRTQHLLRLWASGKPLCISSFFFWNSGTFEQKSQQGLLRALLFQVLDENPDLISIVLPLEWSRTYTRLVADKAGLVNESWSLRQLKDGFTRLVKQHMVPLNLCFFIDGLDEFEGDHDEMAELFKDITSPTVKVCLSSRPWIVFEESFQSCPGLRLQDLTRSDIELYVQEFFTASSPFQRLALKDPPSTAAFVQEIVEKADGVFLWVVIVARSLLNGIRNRDSIPDLRNRLRRLPRELEPLYDHLLELIEPGYYPWASKAFQILKLSQERQEILQDCDGEGERSEGPESLSILGLQLAIDENLELATVQNFTQSQVNQLCEDTAFQLTARCAGLLETWHNGPPGPDSRIHYLHRTVQDYLAQRVVWDDLLSHAAARTFNPDVALLRSYVLQLATRSSHSTKPTDWQYKSAHYALVHANFAENSPVKAPARFLNDLDTIMSTYEKSSIRLNFTHWSNYITKAREMEPATNFLPVAVVYGLVSYVEDQGEIYKTPTSNGITAPLLHYTVPVTLSRRYFPPPQPCMVELLLKARGDVSFLYNTKTPWQQALSYARGQQERGDAWEEQTLLLEILTLMLKSGADPWSNFQVGGHIYSVQRLLHDLREDRNVLPMEDRDPEVSALSNAVDEALKNNFATGNKPILLGEVKKSKMRHLKGWFKGPKP